MLLSFYLIFSAGIDAYEIPNTGKDFISGSNLKINYAKGSLNYSNNLAVALKDSGIKYNPQDLMDYSDSDYIPLIVKYYSPVEFGSTTNVHDLSTYSSNTYTISSISNIAISKGGSVKTSFKTIPYIALKIPRSKIKEFTSDFSRLRIRISDIYVDSRVSAFLNDTTKIIKSNVCTGSVQECTIYTKESDCTSHGCLWKNGGSGVTIAILDTGVDKTHPDLDDLDDNPSTNDPKVIGEKCFCDVGGPCCPNGQTIDDNAHDGFGHGTHVTAIAAGTGKASNFKFVGVAPKAKILAVKVLRDSDSAGMSSDIVLGIEWAVENGANIISMSLGTHSGVRDSPMEDAVRQAISQGVVVVIAAGNWGPEENTIASPGVVAEAITVGASQKDDFSAPYSSRGPADYIFKPDIFAPGGNSYSTCCDCNITCCRYPQGVFSAIPSYGSLWNCWGSQCKDFASNYYLRVSGTSMATPHVAGAAAILKQIHPDWVPAQIKSALVLAATPIIRDKAASCSGSPHDCSAHSGDSNHDGKINASDVIDCTGSSCFSGGLPNNICYGTHLPCNSYISINSCISHGCSWSVNPTYEDVGRIDVYESLNTSIWTNPSILNMGVVGIDDVQVNKNLIIANSGKTRQGVRLIGDSNFIMQFSSNDFCLEPQYKNTVTITIDISSLPLKYYTGRLKIDTFPNCNFGLSGKTHYMPFSFLKLKEVKMTFDIKQFFTPNEFVSWFWRIRNKADDTFSNVDLTQISSNTYHFYTDKEEFDLFGFIEQKDALTPTREKYNFFARRVDLRGVNSLDLYFNTDDTKRLNTNVASVINSKNMEIWYNKIDFGTGNGAFSFVFYDYNYVPLENFVLGVDIPSDTYFKDYAVNIKPIAVEDVNLWKSGFGTKILILPVEFSYPFSTLYDNIWDYQIKNSKLTFFNSIKHDGGLSIGIYPYSNNQDLSYLSYMMYTNLSLPWSYDFSYRDNNACHSCKYLIKIIPYSFSDLNFYAESWNGQSDIYQSGLMPSQITFFEKPFDFSLSMYDYSINGYLLDNMQLNKKLNVETTRIPLKITSPTGYVSNIYTLPSLSWWGSMCQGPCQLGNYKVEFDSTDIINGMRISVTANVNYDGSKFRITSIQKNYQNDPCTGNINLAYLPSTSPTNSYISATIVGPTSCYFNNIYLKRDSCTNPNAACIITFRQYCESYGCSCSFWTPSTKGTYNYYACIDKNKDGYFTDPGEYSMKTLTVTESQPSCLIEGTKVLTALGLKAIEDLNVGDSVIGYKDGKKVETKVLAKMTHSGTWTIYYYKGSWFTGNHKVYPSLNDEAVEVETVSSVKKQYTGNVYDIKTGTENYFGENDLLIHNKGGGGGGRMPLMMDLINIIREFIEKISGFNK